MIRAAIFDLDGVVLDSMSIWRDLGARYLLHRGLTPEPGLGELLFSMSMEQGGGLSPDPLSPAAGGGRAGGPLRHAAGLLL